MKTSQITFYISYWLDAVDEHSLHSPFLFDFHTRVLKNKSHRFEKAEVLRQKLLKDKRIIHVNDAGTKPSGPRHVSEIAKQSLSSEKYSSLYQRIINYYKLTNIVELGTSLGINALYLSSNARSQLTTFEGSEEIAAIAEMTFEFAEVKNVKSITGDLKYSLSPALQHIPKVDFAFLDANHTYEATTYYFKQLLSRLHDKSVVVIDDIHYTPGMEMAWNEIRASKLVHSSIDLYRAGILFFDPSLNKQHVILQF